MIPLDTRVTFWLIVAVLLAVALVWPWPVDEADDGTADDDWADWWDPHGGLLVEEVAAA